MIQYTITSENPLTHLLKIEILIEDIATDTLELQLAAWRPGRYELQHFARNVQQVSAKGLHEKRVPVEKITKDRWLVQVPPSRTVHVTYYYYARQMDAGGSWVAPDQLYINPITCCMAVCSLEHLPCKINLNLPPHWQLATGMAKDALHTLLAQNYEQLVDCPFIASPTLQHQTYTCEGTIFHIWFQGDCTPNWTQLIKDFSAFTQAQIRLFGEFPVPEYHFIFQLLPYRHYHGVEHSNSTVCVLGPGEELMSPALYHELLGISSHELFHTWNIKKIRPAELMPYDYTRENYFRTGYVAEGITTYYGDLLLARSGVIDRSAYFKELNKLFERYFQNYGRHNQSVADASFDTWLDGYTPGTPNRKVSIYVNGAMAALLLDLEIRQRSKGHKTLDDVMRALWQNYGRKEIGYTAHAFKHLAEEAAGADLTDFFREVIEGTVPHEFYLEKLLPQAGCELQVSPNPVMTESVFGFKTELKEGKLRVSAIAPGSPAQASLAIDDHLVAVNGRQLQNNLNQLVKSSGKCELTLFRDQYLYTTLLEPNGRLYYTEFTIAAVANPTENQKSFLDKWLGINS